MSRTRGPRFQLGGNRIRTPPEPRTTSRLPNRYVSKAMGEAEGFEDVVGPESELLPVFAGRAKQGADDGDGVGPAMSVTTSQWPRRLRGSTSSSITSMIVARRR
jgi:hypothetical protein